jgi:hypothetical protein
MLVDILYDTKDIDYDMGDIGISSIGIIGDIKFSLI